MSCPPTYRNVVTDENRAKLVVFTSSTVNLLRVLKGEKLSPQAELAWRGCVAALGALEGR